MRATITIDDEIGQMVAKLAQKRNITSEEAIQFLLMRTLIGIPRQTMFLAREYVPQRIPVMLDERVDRVKKPFRCSTCGNVVFNYYGQVKLIANGQYDADANMADGEDLDWFNEVGVPTEIICRGRLVMTDERGRRCRITCNTIYYRIGQ